MTRGGFGELFKLFFTDFGPKISISVTLPVLSVTQVMADKLNFGETTFKKNQIFNTE